MRKILRALMALVLIVVVGIVGFVVYVSLTYERDFSGVPLPALTASKDPEVIARGAYLAHAVAHCSACHGPGETVTQRKLAANKDDLRGGYVMKAGPFGTYYPANITPDPETGIGKLSDGQLARIIRHGVSPSGRFDAFMAFAVGPMSDDDLVAVISYLRSIPPIANPTKKDEWGFVAKALASRFSPRMEQSPPYARPGAEASLERGAYLAAGPALCRGCHSPFDAMAGFKLSGVPFSGAAEAEPDGTDPSYEIIAPNLTPDPETGALASMSEDGFLNRMRAGRRHAGSTMPWENFAQMTDADLRSIFRYLKSLPPTRRSVGETRRAAVTKIPG